MATAGDTPQARGGIIARLRQMYRRHETMTEIQLDLVVIESFGLFRTEGLNEYVSSESWFLMVLPEVMTRHGFIRTAAVLEKVRLLLPLSASSGPATDMDKYVSGLYQNHRERLFAFGEEIEAFKEDYDAAIDLIFRERWSELPEPLELLPGRWGINPFTGEKTFFKPKYPR